MHPLLDTLLADSARAGSPERPFALLAREGTGTLEVLLGDVVDVALLADIPLVDASGAPQQVLALVPFRQVRERGYECNDDGEPLRCLIVREREEVPLAEAMALGVPVVALDAGAQAWTLCGAGLVWDSAEPALISASIERLRADPALRSELRERGFARVANEFSPQRLEQRLADAIEALP